GCASITAWLSLASGVAKTSVVGQSAPTWTSGTVDRFSSVIEIVRWTGLRCEGEESAGNGSASACATMRASRLLAMIHRRRSRGSAILQRKVPIHDLKPIRSRSSARNDALDEIDDETLGDSSSTLVEQTAFDSFHGCLYLKKFASPFNEDDIFDLERTLNSDGLVGFKELFCFALLLQALA